MIVNRLNDTTVRLRSIPRSILDIRRQTKHVATVEIGQRNKDEKTVKLLQQILCVVINTAFAINTGEYVNFGKFDVNPATSDYLEFKATDNGFEVFASIHKDYISFFRRHIYALGSVKYFWTVIDETRSMTRKKGSK